MINSWHVNLKYGEYGIIATKYYGQSRLEDEFIKTWDAPELPTCPFECPSTKSNELTS